MLNYKINYKDMRRKDFRHPRFDSWGVGSVFVTSYSRNEPDSHLERFIKELALSYGHCPMVQYLDDCVNIYMVYGGKMNHIELFEDEGDVVLGVNGEYCNYMLYSLELNTNG